MPRIASIVVVISLGLSSPAAAQGSVSLIPPVEGSVTRHFEQPDSIWGPGHRGIDLAVVDGTAVRAAAAGQVTFAGTVAGIQAVTIDHGSGIETTYSILQEVLVNRGDRVEQGTWIGHSGSTHPGGDDGVHVGLKIGGAYVDPLTLMTPLDGGNVFHLVPVVPDEVAETLSGYGIEDLSRVPLDCTEVGRLRQAPVPPNENVAVVVAGIGSHTLGGISADIYLDGATGLGYPESRIYRFSYRGVEGPDLHEAYAGVDTYADLRAAAARLRDLMARIALRHPGAKVDLLAHSQGGIVARTYLELVADRWDQSLPQVEHLVTYSTPHGGAPLAGAVGDIEDGPTLGPLLLKGISAWARAGGSMPDPLSVAVDQLAPDSSLMSALATESLPFGTRALTIAIPNDVVVPADRASFEQAERAVVPPSGLNGHDAVVTSSAARSAAYAFLGGASALCDGSWERWGPRVGRAVSFVESLVPALFGTLPDGLVTPW